MKKVLIVSPYFAPENSIASIRFTKIAKYLTKSGYDVTVFRSDMSPCLQIDPYLEKDLSYIKNVYTINYSKLFYQFIKWTEVLPVSTINKEVNKNNRLLSFVYKIITKSNFVYTIRQLVTYYIFEKQNYFKMKGVLKKLANSGIHFSTIITTYSPFTTMELGEYAKRHGLCDKLIMDFRDPIATFKNDTVMTRRLRYLGAKYALSADSITGVSEGLIEDIRDDFLHYTGIDVINKCHVISNGFDPEEHDYFDLEEQTKEEQSMLCFSYCGMLHNHGYEVSNPGPLFQALSELVSEGLVQKEKLRFNYAGKTWARFSEHSEHFGFANQTVNLGVLNRKEVSNVYNRSDIFLVLSWNTDKSKGVMTGKIYESIIAKRNVLCLIAGNRAKSDLGLMIAKYSMGFAFEEANNYSDSFPLLKNWILDRYNEKLSSGKVIYSVSQDIFTDYSHQSLSNKIIELF